MDGMSTRAVSLASAGRAHSMSPSWSRVLASRKDIGGSRSVTRWNLVASAVRRLGEGGQAARQHAVTLFKGPRR